MQLPLTDETYEVLAKKSRAFHRNRNVLPLAVWLLENRKKTISIADGRKALGGRADRPRVIEALERMVAFGAMEELPRGPHENDARYFKALPSPYWDFLPAYIKEIEAEAAGKSS